MRYTDAKETTIVRLVRKSLHRKEIMKTQLILARAIGYNCAALFVNQVVVAVANSTAEIEKLVVNAATQLSVALGAPLVECEVEVPVDMDGTWEWADLLDSLPPVKEQLAKHPFLVYCWSEGGVQPDTPEGPGDAWDELSFDTQSPIAGTPYLILAPLYESGYGVLDKEVLAKALEDFKTWLNDRRTQEVSAVFHATVAKAASLISLKPVQQNTERLVEQVAMSMLGKPVDPAPGVNWLCSRQWCVNDVRAAVRGALEATGLIAPATCLAPADAEPLLEC